MIYKKQDFNNCQFNPLTEDPMLSVYARLTEIIDPDWRDEYLDGILRYMIMVYDPRSPVAINERDLNYRKGIAIELAGIQDETIAESVINSTHIYTTPLFNKFLRRFVRSKEWSAICAFEIAFDESINEVMKPITGKTSREILDAVQKKSLIKQEIIEDIKRLDALYRSFYGGDEELQDKSKRRLTPEMIANGR